MFNAQMSLLMTNRLMEFHKKLVGTLRIHFDMSWLDLIYFVCHSQPLIWTNYLGHIVNNFSMMNVSMPV